MIHTSYCTNLYVVEGELNNNKNLYTHYSLERCHNYFFKTQPSNMVRTCLNFYCGYLFH